MIILELVESVETINQLDSSRPDRGALWQLIFFSKIIKDRDVKYWHNLDLSFQFVLLKSFEFVLRHHSHFGQTTPY